MIQFETDTLDHSEAVVIIKDPQTQDGYTQTHIPVTIAEQLLTDQWGPFTDAIAAAKRYRTSVLRSKVAKAHEQLGAMHKELAAMEAAA